jgi:transcriptional regulator with XRE-family HTH domain
MDNLKPTELKSWREKLGLSQQRLAKFAKVSLATLRKLEVGGQKPQKRTLSKVFAAIKEIESDPTKVVKPPRAVRRGRPKKEVAAPKPKARRGRPPKVKAEKPPKPARVKAPRVKAPRVKAAPIKAAPVKAAPVKPAPVKPAPAKAPAVSSGPIRLSNLDLELISRILNMRDSEKLDLLKKITG